MIKLVNSLTGHTLSREFTNQSNVAGRQYLCLQVQQFIRRTTMMVLYILLLTVILSSARGQNAECLPHSYTNYKLELTWYKAVSRCQQSGGFLIYPMKPNFTDLLDLLPKDGRKVWTGGRYTYSDWKWSDGSSVPMFASKGCAHTTELISYPNITYKTTGPFDCVIKCRTVSNLTAIQEDVCSCLTSPPAFQQTAECTFACPDGGMHQYCGDKNAASVYNIDSSSLIPWDADVTQLLEACVYAYFNSSSMPLWSMRTGLCNSTNELATAVCQDCALGKDNCTFDYVDNVTWMSARSYCNKSHGRELLQPVTNQWKSALNSTRSTKYWIGLHRDSVLVWASESVGNASVDAQSIHHTKNTSCLAAHRDQKGNSVLSGVSCDENLGTLCGNVVDPCNNNLPNTTSTSTTSITTHSTTITTPITTHSTVRTSQTSPPITPTSLVSTSTDLTSTQPTSSTSLRMASSTSLRMASSTSLRMASSTSLMMTSSTEMTIETSTIQQTSTPKSTALYANATAQEMTSNTTQITSVNDKKLSTTESSQVEEGSKSDLTPMYITVGIFCGLLLITAVVLLIVFRARITRKRELRAAKQAAQPTPQVLDFYSADTRAILLEDGDDVSFVFVENPQVMHL